MLRAKVITSYGCTLFQVAAFRSLVVFDLDLSFNIVAFAENSSLRNMLSSSVKAGDLLLVVSFLSVFDPEFFWFCDISKKRKHGIIKPLKMHNAHTQMNWEALSPQVFGRREASLLLKTSNDSTVNPINQFENQLEKNKFIGAGRCTYTWFIGIKACMLR